MCRFHTGIEFLQSSVLCQSNFCCTVYQNVLIFCFQRSYKIVWGEAEKTSDSDCSAGLLVCGADNGVINIYDPTKLIDNPEGEGALVNSSTKHTGPVRALDFNPFQVPACLPLVLFLSDKDLL